MTKESIWKCFEHAILNENKSAADCVSNPDVQFENDSNTNERTETGQEIRETDNENFVSKNA